MNSIILCEGRVDAVLIGQYLASTKGWQYPKKESKPGPNPQPEDKKQIINSYKCDEHWIYLWGVGGRTRFEKPFHKVMEVNILDRTTAFNNIIFVVDRDEEEEDATLSEFGKYTGVSGLQCNEWLYFLY